MNERSEGTIDTAAEWLTTEPSVSEVESWEIFCRGLIWLGPARPPSATRPND